MDKLIIGQITFSPRAAELIDCLAREGLYGTNLKEVVRNIVLEKLRELESKALENPNG